MEPVAIAVICTVVFGVVTAISAFIRQLLLSRDKKLNDEALSKSLKEEIKGLHELRGDLNKNMRLESHYQVLGSNKEAIQYIDQKIEENLNKKLNLIQRYAQMVEKESTAIVQGEACSERKTVCDLLKNEIDLEIRFYDDELAQLQKRRSSIWDANHDIHEYLIANETSRNDKLDKLYQSHTALLEKIYIRHQETSEKLASETIEAGNIAMKYMSWSPIKFLSQFFSSAKQVSLEKVKQEKASRETVRQIQNALNAQSGEEGAKRQPLPKDDLSLEFVS